HTPVRLDRLWTRRSTLPTPLSTPHTSYTLSLHDALPISMDKADGSGTLLFDLAARQWSDEVLRALEIPRAWLPPTFEGPEVTGRDRKSTRLNSSHDQISYAVFCLKKKNQTAIHAAGETGS